MIILFLATSLTGINSPVSLLTPMHEASGEKVTIVDSGIKEIESEKTVQSTEEIVKNYFADAPIMVEIARCESTFRQINSKGEVLRGVVNSRDVGVMQINERFHGDTAEKMNVDIYSIDGNLEYARHLYEKQGTKPWKASEKCWKGKGNV
ncbi:MAG: hypothetical protein AAB534_00800 [Patescibacteria group bacterium]